MKTLLSDCLKLIVFPALCALHLQLISAANPAFDYSSTNFDETNDTTKIAEACKNRRTKLAETVKDGIFLLSAGEATQQNFYYLTGWSGKPAYFVLMPNTRSAFNLFIPSQNAQSAIWNGKSPGKPEAKKLGADSVFNVFDIRPRLKAWIKQYNKIYISGNDKLIKDQLKWIIKTAEDSAKICSISDKLDELRVIKDPVEVKNLQKAVDVTASALNKAFKTIKPETFEYEIDALIEYEYRKNGMKDGFPSIVGSGPNSTALHYEANNRLMKTGDLVVMDIGAQYNGYCADITRTVPVSGKFTPEQRELYALVLKAQLEGIALMKPGHKILDFHNKCSGVICEGLYKLGLITDTTKKWQKELFILYQAGHYLGLDVHDAGNYVEGKAGYVTMDPGQRGRDLKPGMVVTVEPGIYINPERLKYLNDLVDPKVPREEIAAYIQKTESLYKKYAYTGIRIEDDVLITEQGNEVLSGAVPKDPDALEKAMHKK